MNPILYVFSYLGIKRLVEIFEREGKVGSAIDKIVMKLPEDQRLAKAKALWADKEFVDKEFAEANREKHWSFAIAFLSVLGRCAGGVGAGADLCRPLACAPAHGRR